MKKIFLLMIVIVLIIFSACTNTVQNYSSISFNNYYPLTVGKYITYSLDSTVYNTNYGASGVVHKYQVMFVVDSKITDNLGRPSFRIVRYIRKDSLSAWDQDNSFVATPTDNTIEYVENNLRFVKLINPIIQGNSWNGNSYINIYSNTPFLQYYSGWSYTYDSLNMPAKLTTLTVDSTIKVAEVNEQSAIDKTYSVEKYANGIGLVYRNFIYWNNGNANGSFTSDSYGVVMNMIGHN